MRATPASCSPMGACCCASTRRKPRPTPGTTGNVGAAMAKLGPDSQTLEPAEVGWLAVGGIFRAPPGKSIVIWALHRPKGVSLNDADLSRGYILDGAAAARARLRRRSALSASRIPGADPAAGAGHFIALAEPVDA